MALVQWCSCFLFSAMAMWLQWVRSRLCGCNDLWSCDCNGYGHGCGGYGQPRSCGCSGYGHDYVVAMAHGHVVAMGTVMAAVGTVMTMWLQWAVMDMAMAIIM